MYDYYFEGYERSMCADITSGKRCTVVVEPRMIRASPRIVENARILENRHTGRLDA